MPLDDPRVEASKKELLEIAKFCESREYWREPVKLAVVGGWAVNAYNAYSGSIDIDIVGSRRACRSVKNFLVDRRGFEPRVPEYPGFEGAQLHTPGGRVFVDIGRFDDPYPYAGQGGDFRFRVPGERDQRLQVEGVVVECPEITALLA